MIDRMTKYSFVLLSGDAEGFLKELESLGVVDITRSEKAVDEKSASCMESCALLNSVAGKLEALPEPAGEKDAPKNMDAGKVLSVFGETEHRLKELKSEISSARREMESLSPLICCGMFTSPSASPLTKWKRFCSSRVRV